MQSFFFLMNLCSKPFLKSTFGVNVIKTALWNAREQKTCEDHAEMEQLCQWKS
jgi:hypothetical protein